MSRKLVLSGVVVSLGLLLGRLMGFARETGVVAAFGVSTEADIAILALTIPDVLVSLLVAGGLSAALIPEFKALSKKEAFALFLQVSIGVTFFFSIIVILLSCVPDLLVYAFAPGLGVDAAGLAAEILLGVLWLIPLAVLSGITTAYLQSQERFVLPALGTLIFNACVVIGLVGFIQDSKGLDVLVSFILLGGLIRWLSQLWFINSQIPYVQCFNNILLTKDLLGRYFQAIVAMGLLSLLPVVVRAFASFSGEGSLAVMNYAWRLVEFPLGMVITVLSVVLFPKLSEMHAMKNDSGFTAVLKDGLIWSVLLAAVIVGPILASPETFVTIAFGWEGGLSAEKITETSTLLQIGIMVLPFQAVIVMAIAALNAQKRTYISMHISLIAFVLLILFCWLVKDYYASIGVIVSLLLVSVLVCSAMLFVLHVLNKKMLSLAMLIVPLLTGLSSYLFSMWGMTLGLSDIFLLIFFLMVILFSGLLGVCLSKPHIALGVLQKLLSK